MAPDAFSEAGTGARRALMRVAGDVTLELMLIILTAITTVVAYLIVRLGRNRKR